MQAIFAIIFMFGTSLVAADAEKALPEPVFFTKKNLEDIDRVLFKLRNSLGKKATHNDSESTFSPFITDFLTVNSFTLAHVIDALTKENEDEKSDFNIGIPFSFFSPLSLDDWKQEVNKRLENKIDLQPYKVYLEAIHKNGVVKLSQYNNARVQIYILDVVLCRPTFGGGAFLGALMPLIPMAGESRLSDQADGILSAIEKAIDGLKGSPDPDSLPAFRYEIEETDDCPLQ